MEKNNKNLPLSIKAPIYLAIFVAIGTLLAIFFESSMQGQREIKSCKVLNKGRLKSGNTELGLVTHLFRKSSGEYRLAGLQNDNKEWGLYRFDLIDGQTPALEPLTKTVNDMENIGHFEYSLKANFENQSVVRTNSGKNFPVIVTNDSISAKNILSYCRKDWSADSEIKYLDAKTLIANNSLGTVALYHNRRFEDLVPRGAGTAPTALFSILSGNRLEYTDCARLEENSKSRLRVDGGIFAINSGENSTIAFYKLLNENFQLQSNEIKSKLPTFSDFRIFAPDFIFFKRGSWLQKDSEWIFSDEKSVAEKNETEFEKSWQPITMKEDYTPYGEQKNDHYWLAQKSGFIFSEIIMSKIIEKKITARFKIEDSTVVRMVEGRGLWTVLPSGRHIFFGNEQDPGLFAVTDCE